MRTAGLRGTLPPGASLVRIGNLRIRALRLGPLDEGRLHLRADNVPRVLIGCGLLIGQVPRYRLRCRPSAFPRAFRAAIVHVVLASSRPRLTGKYPSGRR